MEQVLGIGEGKFALSPEPYPDGNAEWWLLRMSSGDVSTTYNAQNGTYQTPVGRMMRRGCGWRMWKGNRVSDPVEAK
eukprot:scaffold1525_cov142-Cylindrotheca_fusiformis.AAC.49